MLRIACSFSNVVVVGSEGKGDTPKKKKNDITRTSCVALLSRLALKKLPLGIKKYIFLFERHDILVSNPSVK